MPLKDRDSKLLMTIRPDFHEHPTLVMDLLPKLEDVLLESDINTIKNRAEKEGYEWAANKLLTDYKKRVDDLNPMADALRAVRMDKLADKISTRRLSERDLELLRNATPVLLQDGDPKELIEALFGKIFYQTDKTAILNEITDRSKMIKLLEIYTAKASSLLPMIDALRSYTAQPHIANLLENQQ